MKPTLVILAAGLGSRYGGLKQLDELGPGGQAIMEYTIYDAIQVGFGKVVCVIRRSMEEDFNEAIVSKVEDHIDIECVFQELDMIPEGCTVPEGREKPWGTSQALWVTRSVIEFPLAMVNADDFYGRESLQVISKHLQSLDNDEIAACMVGFRLKNTLSEHGTVSRGICETDAENMLTAIEERTKIARDETGTPYFEKNGERHPLDENVPVSMNLTGFTPPVFDVIREGFIEFYDQNRQNLKSEYYIPDVLKKLIGRGVQVPVLPTTSQWFGVTYKEDKPKVQQKLQTLTEEGVYPEKLWS